MKWGIRRKQAQLARAQRKDANWATKGKGAKITDKVRRNSSGEAEAFARSTVGSPLTSSGKLSKTFVNQYNQKLAQLMNEKVGVHTALIDKGYNMNQVSKGIHSSGRVAYRKNTVRQI